VQQELILGNPRAQLAHHGQPGQTILLVGRGVEGIVVAGVSGGVEGDIRPPHQGLGLDPMGRRESDTHADLNAQRMVRHPQRLRQCPQQLAHGLHGSCLIRLGQHRGKLITP